MIERVAISTVCWKSAPFLPALFESLAATTYPHDRIEFHVVINDPTDGSREEIQRQMERLGERLPHVVIHSPDHNTGFAGGNNLVIRNAMERGIEYVYFLNHDASLEPEAIAEAVKVAESDPMIGSVQSLLVLQQNPEEVNSSGNAIHYIGFGYCHGYHEKRSGISSLVADIAYSSGAGVLFPARIFAKVGLLDETLWLYHEDLDFGWRILLAGYRNVLAPKSVVQHRYEFSRSIAKWYWMERNRDIVILKNYRIGTILLLLPQMIVADIGLFLFALKGGWWKEKLKAQAWFFHWSSWQYIFRGRREIAKIRRVSDGQILRKCTPYVQYQEFESPIVRNILNPLWNVSYKLLLFFVRW